MRFGILGPLLVEDAGARIVIQSGSLRLLLTELLCAANDAVSAPVLEQVLWGDKPPASARVALRNQVLRLRRQLGPQVGARIRTSPPGYLIEVRDGELDQQVFTDLCVRGQQALQGLDWATAADTLADALVLWRGEPGADLPDRSVAASRLQRLSELRLSALRGRIDADLQLGRHLAAIVELRDLTAALPLAEAFHGQLMLALYRADRQAEALDVFQTLRRTLVDELGVEPCPSIQQLHCRMLSLDPTLSAPASTAALAAFTGPAAVPAPVPDGSRFQLPADTRVFTGRIRELEELTTLARQTPDIAGSGTVVISAIDGMAGIGKTALAVHAAHRVRQDFPDGQLFLDLRGHTAGTAPMEVGDALDQLLQSLGVAPQFIPDDVDRRAAAYRDRLGGSRTLVVLDNAASTAQIRPLLPGTPGCLVLVTSRRRLVGLDDAHTLALDVLPPTDAAALLHLVAGPGRVPEDHPAIGELLALCGHLPLAIRIIAARLRHHRSRRVEDLVARLRDEGTRLAHLADEDRDLTAVFDLSYQSLTDDEQRMFRLLGFVPGADLDTCAAASLADVDLQAAEHVLGSLVEHNLLIEHAPGRFRLHDLLRSYAGALASGAPGPEQQHASAEPTPKADQAAVERLLDYYLHTTQTANRHLTRRADSGTTPAVGCPPRWAPALSTGDQATAWMRAELANLTACATLATRLGESSRTLALTTAMCDYLSMHGPWDLACDLHAMAVAAARLAEDRHSEAQALSNLGNAQRMTADYEAATESLTTARDVFRSLGDRHGEAQALNTLGNAQRMTGDFESAAQRAATARDIFRGLGDRHGEAEALNTLGNVQRMTGDYGPATENLTTAQDLFRGLGDRHGEAEALSNLGLVQRYAIQYDPAGQSLEAALVIFRELGNRQGEATTLGRLGDIRRMTGDYETAIREQQVALVFYRELGDRQGEASALTTLGMVRRIIGDVPAAVRDLEAALAIFRAIGFQHGEANVLGTMAEIRRTTGDFDGAAQNLDAALAIFRSLKNQNSEGVALISLGAVRQATCDFKGAAEALEAALAIFRGLNDGNGEADVLNGIATLHLATEEPRQALEHFHLALDIAREHHVLSEQARALEGLGQCHVLTADTEKAGNYFRQALEMYQRHGTPRDTERVNAALGAVLPQTPPDTATLP